MLTQFLAVLVYDNNAGLGTCIFVDDSPEEVAIQAIDNMYQYATDGKGKLECIGDKLDVIDEYFNSDTDDRAQLDIYNLRTLEEVPFKIDERLR